MKIYFLVFLFLISINIHAQEKDTLFMSKLMDKDWAKDFRSQTQFKFIKFEDGSVLGIGDKNEIGSSKRNKSIKFYTARVIKFFNPQV